MASTDARPIPIKNTAYRVTFPIFDADGDLVTGATGLDSEVSKDAGTFADCTNEATEIATSSGMYYLDLTSTEMNADTVAIIVKTSSAGAKTTPIVLYPQESGDIKVDLQTWLTVAPNALQSGRVDSYIGALAAAVITAAGIATDAITSDEIAASAVTEIQSGLATAAALDAVDNFIDTEIADIQARLPAALVSGRMDSSLAAAGLATDAAQEIADYVLGRTTAEHEAAYAETARSLYGMIAALTHKRERDGTDANIILYKSDDSTVLATVPITKDATLTPIKTIDPPA